MDLSLSPEDLAFADRSLESAERTLRAAVTKALGRFGRNEWDAPILDAAELIFRRKFRERTGTNKAETMAAEVDTMRRELHAMLTRSGWEPGPQSHEIISRQAAAAALNAGQDFAMRELDELDVARRWVTMHDNRVRDSHRNTDGQTRLVGQRFLVGPDAGGRFARMRYPGDPTVPISFWVNDRCVLQPVAGRTAAMMDGAMEPTDQDIEELDFELPEQDLGEDPVPWFGTLVVEGAPTGDGRMFEHGAITWGDLPLTFSWQKSNEKGHDSSVVVGRIDQIWREGTSVMGLGVFADSVEADEVIGLIADQMVRGISVDIDDAEAMEFAGGANERPMHLFTKARLRGATLVAIQAFVEASLTLGHPDSGIAAAAFKIDEGHWDGSASGYTTEQWKRACLIDTGEGNPFTKDRYKLPVRTPEGDLSRAGVHAAAGRLNQTDAGDEAIAKAKRALRSAYRELHEDPPDSIAASMLFARGPGWLTDPIATERIHSYWTTPGKAGYAKIGWGLPGDYNRCRKQLAKYIGPEFLNRTCARWHKDAIGVWPGQEGGHQGNRGHFADDGCEDCDMTTTPSAQALAASAATATHRAEFFEDPHFGMLAPLVVTREGRVMGHLASFNQCHMGVGNKCVTAPRSRTGYAYFKLGSVLTERGEVPVGHISLGAGHATLDKGFRAAVEHYDSTSSVVADVTVGEDSYGVWVSGQLRPGVTDDQIAALRAAPLSGDWRTIGGNMELVAALAVNTPGFPIPRPGGTLTASGELADRPDALVAVGVVEREDNAATVASMVVDEMERRALRRRMDSLRSDRNREKMAALAASAKGV